MTRLVLEFVIYAFAVAITPGPNNFLIASIGLGSRRFIATVPAILGVSVGFLILLLLCASGAAAIVEPGTTGAAILGVLGALYLMYLAWGLWSSGPMDGNAVKSAPPLGVVRMALLQFVNPKAWVMGLGTTSAFVPRFGAGWTGLAALLFLFTAVNLISNSTWALAGTAGGRMLDDRPRLVHGIIRILAATLVVIALSTAWVAVQD